jgi:probable F420-dependent oxidoreductase
MKIGISLPVRELGNDMDAIKDFAQAAEELGLSHLRVPDQVFRPGGGALHDPMMLLSWIAAVTKTIELVPSVIILPLRQTVMVAKQAATLDVLSGGRVRLGIGVGGNEDEYAAMGADFHTRGARCDEQMALLQRLWSEDDVHHDGRFDTIAGGGIDPLPVQRPIPMWIGARPMPSQPVINRIGRLADGWFNLCDPSEYPTVRDAVHKVARAAGRDPASIGTEAGVAVVGEREAEWRDRVVNWGKAGLTHICLRTLGGGLKADEHIPKMQQACAELPNLDIL